MTIWMVYDEVGLKRNRDYVNLYKDICSEYGYEVEAVLVDEIENRIQNGSRPVFVLVRTIQPNVNAYFEDIKVPVFNSSEVSMICNNKGKTLERFKKDILCVPSITLSSEMLAKLCEMENEQVKQFFLNKFVTTSFSQEEMEVIHLANDFVLKAVAGHGGKQVFSLKNERNKLTQGLVQSDFVLQPMIEGKNGVSRDMRVYVIGRDIIASVMRSSNEDFRANFSLGGETRLIHLDEKTKRNVDFILESMEFGMAGIDFIWDKNNRVWLNEIEDVVGARMLYQCAPEVNIAKLYVDFIMKKLHLV